MIKGQAKIELFNAETGALEKSVEDHNLVTNALRYLMNIIAANGNSLNDQVFPIATNALGGIMLFDGALEEDPDNVYLPTKDVHLVGYASTNVNTFDVHSGSFNSAESGPTSDGYRSVWDFGTSQANGIIKSIARTHQWAAQDPLRYYEGCRNTDRYTGCPSTDTYWYPKRYDGEYVYMFKGNGDTHTMRVYRVRRAMMRMKVYDRSSRIEDYEPVAEFDTLISEFERRNSSSESNPDIRTERWYADSPRLYYDGGDGYFYCFYSGYNENGLSGYDLDWFTIKYSDDSYEKSAIHHLELPSAARIHANTSPVYIWDPSQKKYRYNYVTYVERSWFRVRNGFLYLIAVNRKRIIQVNLKNTVDVRSYQVIEDGLSDYVEDLQAINLPNGGVFFTIIHYTNTGSHRRNGLLYEDGVFLLHNFEGTNNNSDWFNGCDCIGDHLERWGYYIDTRIQSGFLANYLGTIANLSSPIEKNASQTMKITYELIDVEEKKEEPTEEEGGA